MNVDTFIKLQQFTFDDSVDVDANTKKYLPLLCTMPWATTKRP